MTVSEVTTAYVRTLAHRAFAIDIRERRYWMWVERSSRDVYEITGRPLIVETVNRPVDWSRTRALDVLGIDLAVVASRQYRGDIQGFAGRHRGPYITIAPHSPTPLRVCFHELAHHVLEHTLPRARRRDQRLTRLTWRVQELEAEGVAIVCCDVLGISGFGASANYIASLWDRDTIENVTAVRIRDAARQILIAGTIY
jgi:hypothetical protein